MKVTDYIIDFLISKGVTDIFGYPGGVICHLMDSATKYPSIKAHTNYHEQGAAFAACGYSQSSGKLGVAYTTSGPGATNLVTGIANAYYDSIPTLFLTGQVDTYAEKGDYPVRQRGFQETDVVSIVQSITKYAFRVDDVKRIRYCLEKAYAIAFEGNPGPVLLDLPADVQRADIDVDTCETYMPNSDKQNFNNVRAILKIIAKAKRPSILVGNGVKLSRTQDYFREIVNKLKIPVVSSLPTFDILPSDCPYYFGFIGTNGHRHANFVLGKSDLIIAIGSRLDIRQIGLARDKFAPFSKLIRIDIDKQSLQYKVHEDELSVVADLKDFLPELLSACDSFTNDYTEWLQVCKMIKEKLKGYDDRYWNQIITTFSRIVPYSVNMTLDVGQNQIWFAQSFNVKKGQSVFMSAGHGSMGYSLPAAIGVYYGVKKPVVCVNGDGGLMMNVQELQFVAREKLPITVVCINNYSLGMIRGFQERNFNCNYINTTKSSGYLSVDLKKLANAFDLPYTKVSTIEEVSSLKMSLNGPAMVEIALDMETTLIPNFGRNGLIQDQMPYIERDLFNELMSL